MAGEGINAISNFAAPIAQAGVNYAFAEMSSAKAKERQKELMRYSDTMNLEWWNRTNEYNTPSAQMARLADAGLNPNMMYGTGQGANVSKYSASQSSPNAMNFQIDPVNILGMLGQYQELKLKQAQTDQTNLVNRGIGFENAVKEGTVDYNINQAMYDVLKTGSEAQKANAEQLLESWKWSTGVAQAKATSELNQSQATAKKVEADAYIRNMEADLFRSISNGGMDMNNVMQNLVKVLISRLMR